MQTNNIRTTSKLRALAFEAMERNEWEIANSLYLEAASIYPTSGALAEADKQKLKDQASFCRSMIV